MGNGHRVTPLEQRRNHGYPGKVIDQAPERTFLPRRGTDLQTTVATHQAPARLLSGFEAAAELRRHALELQAAGASMLVLEMVPAPLATSLTAELAHCHTIGIGAGNGTAGQVLVLHDMLGMNLGKMPRFVRNFMQDAGSIKGAMQAYVQAVKDGSFPDNALHAW